MSVLCSMLFYVVIIGKVSSNDYSHLKMLLFYYNNIIAHTIWHHFTTFLLPFIITTHTSFFLFQKLCNDIPVCYLVPISSHAQDPLLPQLKDLCRPCSLSTLLSLFTTWRQLVRYALTHSLTFTRRAEDSNTLCYDSFMEML